MDKVNAFAKKHNLLVIEDNAEAFGGFYKGKKTGTIGDIAGCSFCQNKTFTTGGEGGMVTTNRLFKSITPMAKADSLSSQKNIQLRKVLTIRM